MILRNRRFCLLVFLLLHALVSLEGGAQTRASADRVLRESYLGEKDLEGYSERYQPLIVQDPYRGDLVFKDELFFRNYFSRYLLPDEEETSAFLRSELSAGFSCSNGLLSQHFDDIRYAYRLITLSYLVEAQWHMKRVSEKLQLQKGCAFDLSRWAKSCRPKSASMRALIERIQRYRLDVEDPAPALTKDQWWGDYAKKNFTLYSHYRLSEACGSRCSKSELEKTFVRSCAADQSLMTKICSEDDALYGLSSNRDAYSLIGQSNIINTFNQRGEALGCLRRFSELMAHKELRSKPLDVLFPSLREALRAKYQERYLQGRLFHYGSSREFEAKGLKDLVIAQQSFKVETLKAPAEDLPPTPVPKEAPPRVIEKSVVVEAPPEKPVVQEIRAPLKSAFLQAAEVRQGQDLRSVDVDMTKLKYDYVFSLNMINTLAARLKSFMTRDALKEMAAYDKLGQKEGPVPLLFIKYMIDMEEHQGLYNLVSVLGERFYVSNEIDESFRPGPEVIELSISEERSRQWQIRIVRP